MGELLGSNPRGPLLPFISPLQILVNVMRCLNRCYGRQPRHQRAVGSWCSRFLGWSSNRGVWFSSITSPFIDIAAVISSFVRCSLYSFGVPSWLTSTHSSPLVIRPASIPSTEDPVGKAFREYAYASKSFFAAIRTASSLSSSQYRLASVVICSISSFEKRPFA